MPPSFSISIKLKFIHPKLGKGVVSGQHLFIFISFLKTIRQGQSCHVWQKIQESTIQARLSLNIFLPAFFWKDIFGRSAHLSNKALIGTHQKFPCHPGRQVPKNGGAGDNPPPVENGKNLEFKSEKSITVGFFIFNLPIHL